MKKLVFVDDDASIQDVVRIIFQGLYELVIYSDGERLLDNDMDRADLFLLDKQISGFDGLDVCRFLKSQEATRHIPLT